MGAAFLNVRQVDEAIACLTRAIACDVYLAVAYFQRGVCFYSKNMLTEALADFTDALAFLRGNLVIDYNQLGLAYKLYACEVSFNRGLCFAAVGQIDAAMADFDDAIRTRPLASDTQGGKAPDHRRMEEAMDLQDRAPDYLRPFDVPNNIVYKPPPGKLKNVEKKEYLGKSKVVAAFDENDGFAGFSGAKIKAQTLVRDNTKAPTEMEHSFSRTATIARAPTKRGGSGAPENPIGLDGQPLTFASLNKRAISATTTNAPVPIDVSPMNPASDLSPAPQRRPSAPQPFAPRVSSIRLPAKSNTVPNAGSRDDRPRDPPQQALPTPPEKDRRLEDEVDEMMRYAEERARGVHPGSRRGSEDDVRRAPSRARSQSRPDTPPMSGDERDYGNGGGRYDDDGYGVPNAAAAIMSRRNTTTSFATTSSAAGDKLKIKCHYGDSKILLAVPTNLAFEDLQFRAAKKLGLNPNVPIRFKYRDADGEMVMMTDQEDMEVAFEMAGIDFMHPSGSVGAGNDRFELWCFD
ncbi:hypothetical protein HDU96_005101 [Phlyctochytrium bullatum]|nr:hypothetical protein HDU96_005101 [Phlyctochytrium bullatum]